EKVVLPMITALPKEQRSRKFTVPVPPTKVPELVQLPPTSINPEPPSIAPPELMVTLRTFLSCPELTWSVPETTTSVQARSITWAKPCHRAGRHDHVCAGKTREEQCAGEHERSTQRARTNPSPDSKAVGCHPVESPFAGRAAETVPSWRCRAPELVS